jgi:hypothetical protein
MNSELTILSNVANKYLFTEHTHRFACWTAARAASISRFSNNEIGDFIVAMSLREKVERLRENVDLNHQVYAIWFVENVNQLLYLFNEHIGASAAKGKKFRRVSFGIAAKVISIYVKTAEVLPSNGKSLLSHFAFPPIDAYLLSNLPQNWLNAKSITWSTLRQEAYMNMMHILRAKMGNEPFWKLEAYWNLSSPK